ncbi:putative solute-binding protein, partial [uncultured Agitococcus sp.]|uniref:putative solute-binding protein n=1 Tax=uncultured Agitococcus sp. TaxID=1506599 RepID=UPI00261D0271
MAGKQGPVYSLMKEYALNAARWGTKLDIIPYIDERIAAEDFKAGQCDGVLLTGIRARQFNQATGSIDSIGGLPNYRSVKLLFEVLAKPEASKYMIQNNYEVAGLLPLGA